MCEQNLDKRLISAFPHRGDFFAAGEFVYSPDDPWDSLRSGMVSLADGQWLVSLMPRNLGEERFHAPLTQYQARIGRHVLIDVFARRGAPVDPTPWLDVRRSVLTLLRGRQGRHMPLEELREQLHRVQGIDPDLIDDTLRMMATMGLAKVNSLAAGLRFELSDLVNEQYDRKSYLVSFSEELLAKSRRIDFLIQHTGTVGSYREDLLRSAVRSILPEQYQASTGFIAGCPRQLDIIIWDALSYGPLFREQDVVVVPREAVRSIIEVKTTLSTGPLDEALELLHDVLRTEQSPIPVFKGIFGFHPGYVPGHDGNVSIAQHLRDFYLSDDPRGYGARKPAYLFQGISAICVPNSHFLFQDYEIDAQAPDAWPKPCLYELQSENAGDIQTPAFLARLLTHLQLENGPKKVLLGMFQPLSADVREAKLLEPCGNNWRPQLAVATLAKTLTPAGARTYVERVSGFFAAKIEGSQIAADLGE